MQHKVKTWREVKNSIVPYDRHVLVTTQNPFKAYCEKVVVEAWYDNGAWYTFPLLGQTECIRIYPSHFMDLPDPAE